MDVSRSHVYRRGVNERSLRPASVAVPFLDLLAVHGDLTDALLEDFAEIVDASAFVNGPQGARFKTAFAGYCGPAECVGLASGLDALRLALQAAGVEPGDEVVVP